MPRRVEQATFLPSEVAGITGVNVGLQRTWRHQGYADTTSRDNWTRHSLLQTAAFLVQGELFKRGIPPRVSRICAKAAAPQILMWAQKNPRAIASGKSSKPRGMWLKGKGKPQRFLIQWGVRRKDYAFANDLNAFYRRNPSQDQSAAIVIDLTRLANHLVTAAGRPLATVRESP
jgi:hypothetical protein